jgi:lipopolysaccharide transport system ATP-binding protein
MSLPAISVRNLGKMYRLAHQGKRTNSFREAITSTVLAPFRRLRQLRGTDNTMEEFWALKDVSFDVQPGEVVGIIGRNGAGKSTLLKILSRIVEPTEGEIRLRGRVASLLEVGTGFHPELTGRENIYLNGSILGMKRREIDSKFDEIVDFAEVEKFLDTPVKRYSSGMYVRLAFAVAAHLEPEILIVDEVLAVGDAEFQKKCLGKMKEVSTGTGRTVLFVSHNMLAVNSLCSSGLELAGGGIVACGTSTDVVNHYVNSRVDSLDNALDFSNDKARERSDLNRSGYHTEKIAIDYPKPTRLQYLKSITKPTKH